MKQRQYSMGTLKTVHIKKKKNTRCYVAALQLNLTGVTLCSECQAHSGRRARTVCFHLYEARQSSLVLLAVSIEVTTAGF